MPLRQVAIAVLVYIDAIEAREAEEAEKSRVQGDQGDQGGPSDVIADFTTPGESHLYGLSPIPLQTPWTPWTIFCPLMFL